MIKELKRILQELNAEKIPNVRLNIDYSLDEEKVIRYAKNLLKSKKIRKLPVEYFTITAVEPENLIPEIPACLTIEGVDLAYGTTRKAWVTVLLKRKECTPGEKSNRYTPKIEEVFDRLGYKMLQP